MCNDVFYLPILKLYYYSALLFFCTTPLLLLYYFALLYYSSVLLYLKVVGNLGMPAVGLLGMLPDLPYANDEGFYILSTCLILMMRFFIY
jgi:hypothetical protein